MKYIVQVCLTFLVFISILCSLRSSSNQYSLRFVSLHHHRPPISKTKTKITTYRISLRCKTTVTRLFYFLHFTTFPLLMTLHYRNSFVLFYSRSRVHLPYLNLSSFLARKCHCFPSVLYPHAYIHPICYSTLVHLSDKMTKRKESFSLITY